MTHQHVPRIPDLAFLNSYVNLSLLIRRLQRRHFWERNSE